MSETVAAPRVLIMGVGNILLRDEGFGVAAVNHLEKNYDWPENVRLQEGATQGLLLMSELEECDLLVVLDVVLGGKEPGTVYLLENEDLSRSLSFQGSMHQTDLLQTLQVCELAGCRPQCLAFGLQPFDWRTMQVGLSPEVSSRYPHQFSGGQRQRIGIARALVLQPSFIICDESVSALDVSVQAQVLNLLNDLKEDFGFTYLFISHDLSVVQYMSDHLAVMQGGHIVEYGRTDVVYKNPQSSYTQRLMDAIPRVRVE